MIWLRIKYFRKSQILSQGLQFEDMVESIS